MFFIRFKYVVNIYFFPFRIKKIIRHATTLISASKVVKIEDVAKRTSEQIKLITSKNKLDDDDELEDSQDEHAKDKGELDDATEDDDDDDDDGDDDDEDHENERNQSKAGRPRKKPDSKKTQKK